MAPGPREIVLRRCRPTSSSDTSPDRDRAWLEAALARIPRDRREVTYLGSTYLPSDDSCFCRFEAETADDVRDANEVAGVPFARIVVAEELGVWQRGQTEKGDPS